MVINAEYIVAFARYRVSGTTLFCWTALRGGISRLLPAIFSLWSRLPALLQLAGPVSSNGSPDEAPLGSEEDAEGKVWCELLYDPPDGNFAVDVIFIHGLHGSTVKTWRQGDWNKKYKEVQKTSFRRHVSTPEILENICPNCHRNKKKTKRSSSVTALNKNDGNNQNKKNCEIKIVKGNNDCLASFNEVCSTTVTKNNTDYLAFYDNKESLNKFEKEKSSLGTEHEKSCYFSHQIQNVEHHNKYVIGDHKTNLTESGMNSGLASHNGEELSDSDEDLLYFNASESTEVTLKNIEEMETFDYYKNNFYHKIELDNTEAGVNIIRDNKFRLVINSNEEKIKMNLQTDQEILQNNNSGLRKRNHKTKSQDVFPSKLSADSSVETDCDSSFTLNFKRDISCNKKFFKDDANCDRQYINSQNITKECSRMNLDSQSTARFSENDQYNRSIVLVDKNNLKTGHLNIKEDANSNRYTKENSSNTQNEDNLVIDDECLENEHYIILSNKRKYCPDANCMTYEKESTFINEKYDSSSDFNKIRKVNINRDTSFRFNPNSSSDVDDYSNVVTLIEEVTTADQDIINMQQAIKNDIDIRSKFVEDQFDSNQINTLAESNVHVQGKYNGDQIYKIGTKQANHLNSIENGGNLKMDVKLCEDSMQYNSKTDGSSNNEIDKKTSIDFLEQFFISEKEHLNLDTDMTFVYSSTERGTTKNEMNEDKSLKSDNNDKKSASVWEYFFTKRKIKQNVNHSNYSTDKLRGSDYEASGDSQEIKMVCDPNVEEKELEVEIDGFENSLNTQNYCSCNFDQKMNQGLVKDIATKPLEDVETVGVEEQNVEDVISNCWPRDWIPMDYPNARVLSLSYTTDQYLWRPIWVKPYNRSSLEERSKEMVRQLRELHVGDRPILWVGHSKGGLFIKQIFTDGYECWSSSVKDSPISAVAKIFLATRGFVFYSVPHRGSPLANLTLPPLLRTSSELWEIQFDGEFVLRLHKRFLKAFEGCGDNYPAILSFSETRRTLMGGFYLRIVSPQSADPGVGGMYGVSLDHREICKPSSRTCFLYQEFLCLLKELINNPVDT